MKRILIALIAILLPGISLFARNLAYDDEFSTLFDSVELTGAYFAPEIKLSSINNNLSMWVGGKLMFTMDHKFGIGLAGYGLIPCRITDNPIHLYEDNYYLTGGYGGLVIEYNLKPQKIVHFSVNTLIGAGGGVVYNSSSPDNNYPHSAYFVVDPGILIDLNVLEWLQIGIGASYRYTSGTALTYQKDGVDSELLSKNTLNGLSSNLIFRFGTF